MSKIVTKELKNGIKIFLEEVKEIKTFSMGIFVATGAKHEFEKESGISHFIEHMLFKGTKNRSAKDISELIDREGGAINAFTSRETTGYYVKLLSSKIDVAIDILSDMFLNSTFTKENMSKERKVIIEEINMYEDIPEDIIHDKNIEFALTGIQSNNIAGTPENLKKITRDGMIKYFKERYIPSNIVISISGNIDIDYVFSELDKKFSSLENSDFTRELDTTYKINSGEQKIKRDTNQVHICFNTIGCSSESNLKYPISIISNILGGGMSSRLFQEIREDKGLAYSVYSYMASYKECGLFTVYTGTTKENYKEVLDIIKKEFENIKQNGITEDELRKSKNQFASYLTFNLENSLGRMKRMANSYLIYGKILSIDDIIKNIEAIKIEDIQKAIDHMFREEYYSWTILGDI